MSSQQCPPTARERLEQAETLVIEGEKRIERQRQFLADMEEAAAVARKSEAAQQTERQTLLVTDMEQAALLAREVLGAFEDAQAIRIANRDRLLKELSAV